MTDHRQNCHTIYIYLQGVYTDTLGSVQLHMSWRRRHLARLPPRCILAQVKFNMSTILHEIVVLEPVLRPLLPIDLHALHIVPLVQSSRGDAQRLVSVDGHVEVGEPWGSDEIHGLRDDGVHAEHLPQEPGVHGAGVAVSGYAVGGVFEAVQIKVVSV